LYGEDIFNRKCLYDIVIIGGHSRWDEESSADDAESSNGSKMRETHIVDGCMPSEDYIRNS
jgi:hypothetical protein